MQCLFWADTVQRWVPAKVVAMTDFPLGDLLVQWDHWLLKVQERDVHPAQLWRLHQADHPAPLPSWPTTVPNPTRGCLTPGMPCLEWQGAEWRPVTVAQPGPLGTIRVAETLRYHCIRRNWISRNSTHLLAFPQHKRPPAQVAVPVSRGPEPHMPEFYHGETGPCSMMDSSSQASESSHYI